MNVDLDGRNHQPLIRLADAYRSACELVRPTWEAMLATPTATPERVTAIGAYNDALRAVILTRDALLQHVRGSAQEVGQ